MNEQIIKCPKCKNEFPLSETLAIQIRESMQDEILAESTALNEQLAQREKEFKDKEQSLKKKSKEIDSEVENRLAVQLDQIKIDQKAEAKKEVFLEMKELQDALNDKDAALEEAQKNELALRKDRKKLENDKKSFELKMQRQLDAERETIREEAHESISEEYSLKEADFKHKIEGLTKEINNLKKKSEQGSQQAQGEVMELRLENLLNEHFPQDNIKEVPKGMRGADVIQDIYDESGHHCGSIIWESKRTKNWSNNWIEKLKEDQRSSKADIAVILSSALPADITSFGLHDGIWVTDFKSLAGLANALRINIIEISRVQLAGVGKNHKMEMMYNYLVGQEFKNRIEALVESFQSLQADLIKEKTAITKLWAKREKQIGKALESSVGIYGDLHGIIGLSMPEIEQLELPALPVKEEDH